MLSVSVRPSVRHIGVAYREKHRNSRAHRQAISALALALDCSLGTLVNGHQTWNTYLQGLQSSGALNRRWQLKSCDVTQICGYISSTVQDRDKFPVIFPITLSDP